MRIDFIRPSSTEAEMAHNPESGTPLSVRPRRWANRQQSLTVMPLEVVNDKGAILDAGVLTVNQRTGKLTLTKVSNAELDCEADKMRPKTADKKEGDV
jgi:hypothetical protein